MIKGKTFVILSPQKWEYPYVSKHYYALELLKKGAKVFYINPPVGTYNVAIEESQEYSGLKIVNYGYGPLYPAKFHAKFIFRFLTNIKLGRIKKLIESRVDYVWCFDNTGQYFDLTIFQAEKVLFFPVDTIAKMQKVIKGVEYVFTISKEIKESLRYDCPQYIIDHGLNDYFVSRALKTLEKNNNTTPQSIRKRKIHVGMVGNLTIDCLDVNVLKQLVETYSNIQFNFFGNYKHEGKIAPQLKFLEISNVTFHGVVPAKELVEYFHNIDIFILTYKRTKIFRCDNSHKILEYLSSGKSVVSTYIERYKEEDVLYMLSDENNFKFIDLFNKVINNLDDNNNEMERDRRISYALRFSYENNLKFILRKLSK